LPAVAAAQSTTSGSIAGSVKDTTGAVLPGVSVEASSPALIEKVRTVTTDAEGNYRIVDLRPGTYSVTFTLQGFKTVKREGIELTTGFTAAVNGELSVGEVSESVTVTGETPIVDVQNTRVQNVLTRDVLEATPSSRVDYYTFSAMTLGAQSAQRTGHDVGGNQGGIGGSPSYHGVNGGDSKYFIDGMPYNAVLGNAGGSEYYYFPNQLSMREVNMGLGAQSAEYETGGVQLNYVPKEGANRFTFNASGSYANDNFQGSNLTSEIRAAGLTNVESIKRADEIGFGFGGPIVKDRAWFFIAPYWTTTNKGLPGAYFNATQHSPFFTPDLNNPVVSHVWTDDYAVRFTAQASAKDKLTFSFNRGTSCLCSYSGSPTVAPEFIGSYSFDDYLYQGTWTRPQTSKLLFQAGISYGNFLEHTGPQPDVLPTDISTIDIGTGVVYGASAGTNFNSSNGALYNPVGCCHSKPLAFRVSASYVTGSHAFKVGLNALEGWQEYSATINQSLQYLFLSGHPIALTQFADPFNEQLRMRSDGLYAQDQWTVKRFTLNLGLRYDYLTGWVEPQTIPAGRFVGQRSFGEVDDVPNWKDINPRLGVVWDVFGNGKTAVKANVGRYVISMGVGVAEYNNPALTAVVATTRTWIDGNGNFVPDCNLTNLSANGECGAVSNRLFGQTVPGTTFADNMLHGFGNRTDMWQTSIGLQQELRPGLSANVLYSRNTYGNIWAQVNTAVSPSDFTQFCVTAPVDARLPGGGGNQICGNYDVNPAKFGLVSNVIEQASSLGAGDVTHVYNGVDVSLTGRFGKGAYVSGGVSIGRTTIDDCALSGFPNAKALGAGISDSTDALAGPAHPLSTAFCHVTTPWDESYQIKANGVYPLPYQFEIGGVFQMYPGAAVVGARGADACQISTCLTYTNAQVAPSLGRNLSSGAAGTVTIPIVTPKTLFEEHLVQMDVRLSKVLTFGRVRAKANIDVYNLFNRSTVYTANSVYGPLWLQPQQVMGARYAKISGQFEF
jgi:hypothetical protein